MNWFRRKPSQQKYVEAAITVASNLYLHTIPGQRMHPPLYSSRSPIRGIAT